MTTRTHLTGELEGIRHDLLAMGARVEENLAKAMAALRTQDVELAREARAGDADVDAMQLSIEDRATTLLATQQPVARDLRELITVFKVTENLERAGDYSSHLAKAAVKLAGSPPFRSIGRLERMAGIGGAMVRGAVSAFIDQDAAAARAVAAMDDGIDAEHRLLVEDALGLMRENPDLVQRAVKVFQTSSWLERLGDHMTNVCEAVVYLAEGSHVELND